MRASKTKNGAKPVSRGPEILRVEAVGPGVVQNLDSIAAAFEALTGVSLEPGASPAPEQWAWVEQALAPFGTSHDESMRIVMEEIVRLAQADDGRLVGERLTTR